MSVTNFGTLKLHVPTNAYALQTVDGEEEPEAGAGRTLYVVETMKLEDTVDEDSSLALIAGTQVYGLCKYNSRLIFPCQCHLPGEGYLDDRALY